MHVFLGISAALITPYVVQQFTYTVPLHVHPAMEVVRRRCCASASVADQLCRPRRNRPENVGLSSFTLLAQGQKECLPCTPRVVHRWGGEEKKPKYMVTTGRGAGQRHKIQGDR